ncbi:hypothetical protein HYS31_04985 [Candidatus Woesearchaeota archaeon]|nr:hypothetical protein [Candidatus Woesearchaeota archaeon]
MKKMAAGMPDQTQVWDKKYGSEDYFGSSPSRFAEKVVPYARRLNVRDILELGCGQGHNLFCKEWI